MSYCVHCGVKLADRELHCPLCGTPVIDPDRPAPGEPLFVDRMDLTSPHLNRTFLTWLIFGVLMIPFLVTAILDLVLTVALTWSFYVLGAEILFGVCFLLPFLHPHLSPYSFVAADCAASALYLLLIALLNGGMSWYFPLALPITLLTGWLAVLTVMILRQPHMHSLAKAGWIALPLSAFLFGIDMIIGQFRRGSLLPVWAWYAAVPVLVLGIVILLLSRSVRATEWIRRRLFV